MTIDAQNARADAIAARREELLTVKEFAAMQRLHVESVRRRIRAGRQPGALRVGGQWRIDVVVALREYRISVREVRRRVASALTLLEQLE